MSTQLYGLLARVRQLPTLVRSLPSRGPESQAFALTEERIVSMSISSVGRFVVTLSAVLFGRSALVTGDLKFHASFATAANGVDVLVSEAQRWAESHRLSNQPIRIPRLLSCSGRVRDSLTTDQVGDRLPALLVTCNSGVPPFRGHSPFRGHL
jgi:hypothetical protein